MVKILVVEDSEIVRRGLVRTLSAETGLNVVGAAENGKAALGMLRSGLECDLMLADLNMPIMDGFELSEKIREEFPVLKVVILTMHAKADFKQRARESHVAVYLLKQQGADELGDSIRLIASGIGIYM